MATHISDVLATDITVGSSEEQVRRSSSCEVDIAEGADAIEHAARAWQAIEDAGGVKSPFQSLAAARGAVAAHIANGEMPRIVTARSGNRPVAIFPTVVSRWLGIPSIRFLGEPFIQYGDVIARPDTNAAYLEAALAAASDARIASLAFFRRVRADAAIAPILARCAAVVAVDAAPVVDLHDQTKVKSHHARELRRFRRRLSEQGELVFEVLGGTATRDILHETLEFKRAWLIERGLPSTVFGNPSWESVILGLAGARCGATEMMVARVAIGGATAASEIGFVDGDTWFAYMGALAPDSARFGPGHILMEELIAWCRARGLKAYDLLPPIQPYKLALTSRMVPIRDYALALGAAGFPGILAARMVPTVKRMAEAAPVSLRRWMIRRHLQTAAKK